MTPRRRDPGLDELIADITVDCNDEDEELMGFENFFDEWAALPCPGTVIGEDVQVLSVATQHGRRELVATCERERSEVPDRTPRRRAQGRPCYRSGCSPLIDGGLSAAEDLNSYE